MATLDGLIDLLERVGLEGLNRYYGLQKAIVERNDDPEERGRIQVLIPRTQVGVRLEVWLLPIFMGGGPDRGMFWPPEVGDRVWVVFENGNPSKPLAYIGNFYTQSGQLAAVPNEFAYEKQGDTVVGPNRRGFITRIGHRLVFDDTPGSERLELVWHKPAPTDAAVTDRKVSADRSQGDSASLVFTDSGSIEITNASGTKVVLDTTGKAFRVEDENGNSCVLDANGITFTSSKVIKLSAPTVELDAASVSLGKGADSFALRATEFFQAFLTHTHVSAAPGGPTSTPVPPPAATAISTVVKLK